MNLYCSPDEWWPVLVLKTFKFLHDNSGEFTGAEIARLKAAQDEFNACQQLIATRCNISRGAARFEFVSISEEPEP